MSWMDLLRMSGSNLKRRKLRTFLTVLGVVIGTTSFVVMISLGLGMQESLYREVEQSGGLTSIKVTGEEAGGGMYSSVSFGSDEDMEASEKYIDDETVAEFGTLEHVVSSYPVYETSVIFLKGKYEGYGSIKAMPHQGLAEQNIPLAEGGRLPQEGGTLELVFGNTVITDFQEKGGGGAYWETGILPDIDLAKDSLFLILDQDGYYNMQSGSADMGGDMGDMGEGGEVQTVKNVKKHVVKACGVVEGGPDDYNMHSMYVYCDLDVLVKQLKKEFAGRVIRGQPTTNSGKPYKDFYYSSAQVKVDDIDNVNAVSDSIRQLGYGVETNIEYLQSMQKELAMIEAVLGGIGAISLFVAAIGIANTMMMSIYERTKEIGVIKVLGCSLKNIKQMFLMEAASIGLIGGVVGNILSFILSAIINYLTAGGAVMGFEGNISYIPLWLVLVSMGFAMLVGIMAGYFPAKRAMKLSPLAAIRSE